MALIIKRIIHYLEKKDEIIVIKLPDIKRIAKYPYSYSFFEMEKLLKLLLCCAMHCDKITDHMQNMEYHRSKV